jgi:hypothetical protein
MTLVLAGVTASTVISVFSASAAMRISDDQGGLLTAYAERFEAARASGEPVIIDGRCLSACTLAIGILPRGQVCATPNAVLGFHAAWRPAVNGSRVNSPGATRAMYEAYPSNVRKWIAHRGGLSGRLILLKGRELTAMVPICGSTPAVGDDTVARTMPSPQRDYRSLGAAHKVSNDRLGRKPRERLLGATGR